MPWDTLRRAFIQILDDMAEQVSTQTLFVAATTATTFTYVQVRDRTIGHVDGGQRLPLSSVYCQAVVETGATLCLPDTRDHPLFARIGPDGARAYLGVPIRHADGELYGTLCATHDETYGYSADEVRWLEMGARWIGLLLDMELLAVRDPLTDVYSRSFFEHHVRLGVVDLGSQWAIVALDFDALKGVNDTWGHATGDAVIRGMAHRIQAETGTASTVIRMGGDEFLIVCPQIASLEDVGRLTNRIILAFQEPLRLAATPISVTVSCGYAASPWHGMTVDDVYQAADRALYAAKQLGGNQAVAAADATSG